MKVHLKKPYLISWRSRYQFISTRRKIYDSHFFALNLNKEIMKKEFQLNNSSILIMGCILMVIPMLSHPHITSIEALMNAPGKMFSMNIFTHSVAMLSIPFVLFGLWSLTRLLNCKLASIAFITASFGMFAIMCATTMDGLVTTLFINKIRNLAPEISQVKLLIAYVGSMVQSFSIVYVFTICIAIFIWSVLIANSNLLPKWVGYYGMSIVIAAMIAIVKGVVFVDFIGIKIFVVGFVSYTLILGVCLRQFEKKKVSNSII